MNNMAARSSSEREISIAWFNDLTGLLGKYLAVLRYELEQSGDTQTVEALIHAEIVKILVRGLTPGCVVTEYPIGGFFSKGLNEDGDEFSRGFRADVAIYHPVDDPSSRASLPVAVIELKRKGPKVDIVDDIYRLVIVSLHTKATGYFVFAGPKDHVGKVIDGIPLLNEMNRSAEADASNDEPHGFAMSELSGSSIYNASDHSEAQTFYGQRLFGEENSFAADPYQIRIFAFHQTAEAISARHGQRLSLKLSVLEAPGPKALPFPELE